MCTPNSSLGYCDLSCAVLLVRKVGLTDTVAIDCLVITDGLFVDYNVTIVNHDCDVVLRGHSDQYSPVLDLTDSDIILRPSFKPQELREIIQSLIKVVTSNVWRTNAIEVPILLLTHILTPHGGSGLEERLI